MSLKDNATWKAVKPFMNGGLSGMGATCIIQPLDIVKVRAVTSTPPRRREGRADCARRRDDRRRATPAATPRGAFHSMPPASIRDATAPVPNDARGVPPGPP
jgi:hypothetical protein